MKSLSLTLRLAWALVALACCKSSQTALALRLTTTAGPTANIPASLQEGVQGIAINSHDVTIHVSLAPDEDAPFFIGYSINGGDEIRYTGPGNSPFTSEQALFISGLPDGPYTIAITAYESRHNHPSPVTLTYSFAVDTTPPVTTLLRVPPMLSNEASFTFKFNSSKNSSEYGRLSFFCSSNGGQTFSGCGTCRRGLIPCVGEYTLDLGSTPDGAHEFVVYSLYTFTVMDPLVTLKELNPPSYDFVIDVTPPTITISETPKLRSNSTRAKFLWQCYDSHAPVSAKCKVDGRSITEPTKRAWSDCQSPLVLHVSPKTHALQLFCLDGVGNPTPTVLYTWLVHQRPPLSQFNTDKDKQVITVPHSARHPNHQQPQGMYGYTTAVKEVNGVNTTAVETTNASNITIHFQCGHPQSFGTFSSSSKQT